MVEKVTMADKLFITLAACVVVFVVILINLLLVLGDYKNEFEAWRMEAVLRGYAAPVQIEGGKYEIQWKELKKEEEIK